MPLVIATGNVGKIAELRDLLPKGIVTLTVEEVAIQLPPETGMTYADNALTKARAATRSGYPAIADDSGLEVDALGGLPGVRSARYAGVGASDGMNNAKLLAELAGVPPEQRGARFKSEVALVTPTSDEFVGRGSVEGRIIEIPRGNHGFGYDPLFELRDLETPTLNGLTIAEMMPVKKNQLSHRARAIRDLLSQLRERGIELVDLTGDRFDG